MNGLFKKIKSTYLSIFAEHPQLIYISVISFLAELGYSIIIPTLPLYLVEGLKAKVILVGLTIGAYALSETIFKIPCGILGDRIGRKWVILLGAFIPGVCFFFMIYIKNPYHFIPLWAVAGFGAAALWPGIIAYLSDIVPPEKRATALSVFNMCYMIGLGVGPPLGVLLNLYFTFRGSNFHLFTFFLAGILLFLSFFLIMIKIKNVRPLSSTKYSLKNIMDYIRMHPDILSVTLVAFLFMFSGSIVAPVVIIYAKQDIGLSEELIRMLFLPVAIFLAVAAIPIGKFSDKLGKKRALIIGLLIIGVVMIVATEFKTLPSLILLIGMLGVGYGFVLPSWLALVSMVSPKETKGFTVGIAGTGQSFGFILGPVVGAHLWDTFGHKIPFVISGGLLLGCAAVVYLIFRRQDF